MEQQFINLRQESRTVDKYAAKFLRLSQFAPYMVAKDEDQANQFKQGLRLDIQKFLIAQQLRTYSQVLSVARCLEQVEKDNRSRL